jgi:signal transduction histidine kinase
MEQGMDTIATATPQPSGTRAPSAAALCAVAAAAAAAASCTTLLALTSDHIVQPGVHAGLQVWGILAFVVAGTVAWWRRPESRFGILMVVAGAAWFLSTLSSANLAVPYTIGLTFDLVPAVVFLHVVLAYPNGRLERPFERAIVAVGYVTALGVHTIGMTLGGFGPDNLAELVSRGNASRSLENVQLVVISAICLAGVVVLALRRREAGPPLRRSLTLLVDSFAAALVMFAFLFLSAVFGLANGETSFETIRRVTFFVVGLAPLVFLVGLLHGRLARSAVGDLIVELQADPTPTDLRDALSRAVRDPSLTLVYWLPEFGTYAGVDGRPVEPAADFSGRAMTLIDRNGAPVAALLHDPSLEDEPELLAAATAGAGIALENARLHVELRARLEELRGSRARLVDVANKERQRLERNLHDGAQQRLIALSLELSLLGGELGGDRHAQERLARARREIAASLAELREIARGIHPAVVSGHGLGVALEQLAALAPVPVRLSVATHGRLPEAVEVAAYYLVCESLANVGKYAQASTATVDVRRSAGTVLIEVTDDGVGGADTECGTGLRGIADRVEALDGTVRVWSPPGGGTRILGEIPCAP